MKKLFTSALVLALSLAAALAASAQTTQTIRRVSLTATGTNIYATFALAQSAAANNDIIQMEPGTYAFDIILTKPLVVVGPGYFLDLYTGAAALQANTTPATVANIVFDPGSSGTSVSGLTAGNLYVGTDNVTVQRCTITSQLRLNYNSQVGPVAVNNVNIRQNYLGTLDQYTSGFATTNILVTNNIITNTINLQYNTSGEFRNNVQPYTPSYSASLNNFNVVNNYFGYLYATPAFSNCTVTYNAFRFASAPTAGNNQNNVVQTNVFPYAPGATQYDAWFQLKAGTNSLRGAGENGVDIGAFAGNAPYRLGGLPAIPSIYQLSNSVSGNTLNVNLSTRSNN